MKMLLRQIDETTGPQTQIQSEVGAFTMVEMLVVIGVVGILAALLLPALIGAKNKAKQTSCLNGMKQLGLGFQLYHSEYDDMFPAPGSRHLYGPQPEDWIWWQFGRNVTNSSIVRFISGFSPALFTCPMDKDALALQNQGLIANDPYRYSYSLTSYNLTNNNTLNPGMATIITLKRELFPFRLASIKNPSAKLMLVEEDRSTINDSRWVAGGTDPDSIANRHSGKGNAVFADSHVEAVTPAFGSNPINSAP